MIMAFYSTTTNSTQHFNLTTERKNEFISEELELPTALTKELPIIVLFIGSVFNITLLYYLLGSKKYRIPLFTLITSLAFADLCACISGAGTAAFIAPTVQLPRASAAILCKVIQYMSGAGITSSTHHLVLFAALRFYQLCYPLKSRARLTFSFMRTCCLGLWLVILAAWIPWAYFITATRYGSEIVACFFTGNIVAAQYGFLICNTIYPAISIPLLYITKHIWVLRGRKSAGLEGGRNHTDVKALGIIIIVFFITWLPNNIFALIVRRPGVVYPTYYYTILDILSYLMYSNSAINPLIYCFAAETVRTDLVRFLSRH